MEQQLALSIVVRLASHVRGKSAARDSCATSPMRGTPPQEFSAGFQSRMAWPPCAYRVILGSQSAGTSRPPSAGSRRAKVTCRPPQPKWMEEVLVSENKEKLIVITGAGGFIGGHLVSAFRARGYKAIRARRHQAVARLVPALRRCRESLARSESTRELRNRGPRRPRDLQPRRQHGRDGIHRKPQSALHAFRSDQYAHAAGGRPTRGATLFSIPPRRAFTTRTSRRPSKPLP